MASGLPKDLAMIGASANARFRPWQFSCPKPPSGFSPWRMKTIVSTAFSVCPALPPTRGIDHDKAATTAVLTSTLKVKLLIKLVDFSAEHLASNCATIIRGPWAHPIRHDYALVFLARCAGSPIYPTA